MNQKIKELQDKKIAIHCPTEEEANELMKVLDENGFTWSSKKSLLEENIWEKYKENTCYDLYPPVCYSPLGYYKKHRYKVITFQEFKQQYMQIEQPKPFSIQGTPSLIKAMWEEMKVIGYKQSSDRPDQTWISLSQNHLFGNIKDLKDYAEIFINQGSYPGVPEKDEIVFNLPQDWDKCLQYVKDAYNSPYWNQKEEKETYKIITIGSRATKVNIYKSGKIDILQGANAAETDIKTVQALLDKIACIWNTQRIAGFSLSIEADTRFIRIGCLDENNLFSLSEIKEVIKTHNYLQ